MIGDVCDWRCVVADIGRQDAQGMAAKAFAQEALRPGRVHKRAPALQFGPGRRPAPHRPHGHHRKMVCAQEVRQPSQRLANFRGLQTLVQRHRTDCLPDYSVLKI